MAKKATRKNPLAEKVASLEKQVAAQAKLIEILQRSLDESRRPILPPYAPPKYPRPRIVPIDREPAWPPYRPWITWQQPEPAMCRN